MSGFKKWLLIFACGMTSAVCSATDGGVQLDRTRLVVDEGKTSVGFGLRNHYERSILASAHVTNFDGTPTTAFAVSPGIFQVKPKGTTKGQVILTEALPQDRETVFWLNVRTVLSKDKQQVIEEDESSTLTIAMAQRIKVFYRPKAVSEKCEDAAKSLTFKTMGNELIVENPSTVSVSVTEIVTGEHNQRIADTVMPKSKKTWRLEIPLNKDSTFTYIDEYGNFINHGIKSLN